MVQMGNAVVFCTSRCTLTCGTFELTETAVTEIERAAFEELKPAPSGEIVGHWYVQRRRGTQAAYRLQARSQTGAFSVNLAQHMTFSGRTIDPLDFSFRTPVEQDMRVEPGLRTWHGVIPGVPLQLVIIETERVVYDLELP